MSLPIPVVFARSSQMVELPNGTRVRVMLGSHWAADDPLVRSRPELFTRDSRFGMLYTQARDEFDPSIVPPMDDDDFESRVLPDAEDTSAVPGEKRSVRRRRSSVDDEPTF